MHLTIALMKCTVSSMLVERMVKYAIAMKYQG
jgi:hypothetical protein